MSATIAASSEARAAAISCSDAASIVSTPTVIAASACQPSMMAPQSMEMMSPDSSTVSPGMPCTTTSLGDAQITPGNPW